MSRSRHAAGAWSKVRAGESFLRDQARIRERRQTRRACLTRDWRWLEVSSVPRWALWS